MTNDNPSINLIHLSRIHVHIITTRYITLLMTEIIIYSSTGGLLIYEFGWAKKEFYTFTLCRGNNGNFFSLKLYKINSWKHNDIECK